MDHKKKSPRIQTGLTLTAGAVALSFLAACGGGGSGSSSASSSAPPSSTASTPSAIGGTVAVGDALAGANVTLIDANGKGATATSDTNGNYSIPITGLTAPFLLVATDPSGVNAPLYSVMPNVPTGSAAPLVANVTPLTTAVAAELTSDGNPLDLTSPATLAAQVTPAAVNNAVSTLDTILAPVLSANGVTASSFNPVSTAFTPNQTGPDAVIDSVTVTTAPSGGLQLATTSAPGTAIALDTSTTASTQLAAPPEPANYLSTLLAQLSSCLSGTASACGSAIDAHYLENGYGSTNQGSATAAFEAVHYTLAASGSTVTGAKTLMSWPAGQSPFPDITGPSALVRIFYTGPAGQHNGALTVVQQTQAASASAPAVWDIVGNQQAYDVTINSFVTRRQFLDAADANVSRDESGLSVSITAGAGSVNPANVNAVNVSGPGLPAGGVWLEPRSGTGNDLLALSSKAVTAAPTSAVTSSSNTSLYRWSWQALPSNAGAFAFSVGTGDAGYYAPAALTTQTLPAPFATYTATFYDAAGAVIGSPVTVINPTPPLLPDAAAGVAWPTLGSDVVSSFLTPSGSLAAAQATASIDWSGIVNGQNLAPVVTGVQIQDGSDTSSATPAEVDGWWTGEPAGQNGQYTETVTAGVAQDGTQTCATACTFPALTGGVTRLVQLTWNDEGASYYTVTKDNN
ncbi:hypothetical protein CY652_23035 [Burkholderia sp. WAC0059]|uniref:hypothetical protein n=1 Tax=Burkholderia sp. WAC0059 TaxID=2066022 RepID=UPI000C7F7531|nr:hypothetical protein [Burkholderia sp. WAC0059]PLZ00069.1 hypothetical protein CY652_23035 [Burkholderia sp. WAC0059]